MFKSSYFNVILLCIVSDQGSETEDVEVGRERSKGSEEDDESEQGDEDESEEEDGSGEKSDDPDLESSGMAYKFYLTLIKNS